MADGISRSALLFVAVAVVLALYGHNPAQAAQGSDSCGGDWHYHDDHCYLMRNEYETATLAEHSCATFGANLAYAEDPKQLAFINGLVGKQTTYGWWYGLRMTSRGDPAIYNEDKGYYSSNIAHSDDLPLPKTKESFLAPSTGCIGLSRDNRIRRVDYVMVDVPCDVTLPYACTGSASDPKIPTNDKNIIHNDTQDVFWFSSVSDRRSHDDAVKACGKMSMTLMSIRGLIQGKFIRDQLDKRQDSHADPWWTGLRADNGKFSWSSGVGVEPSVINWSRIGKKYHYSYYHKPCRLLLSDGSFDDKLCHDTKAPFICKRAHGLNGQFACPPKWSRAGQSCYLHATLPGQVTYEDAQRICSKNGAHAISVDTPLEKLWLTRLGVFNGYSTKVWTSLNDKKKDGSFVWANGKSPDPKMLKWSVGWTLEGRGECFSINLYSNTLQRYACERHTYPGCQYPANGPGDCVTKNWQYFKGHCYYDTRNDYYRGAYLRTLQHCYADVLTKNNEIVVSPLKADSMDIIDFYVKHLVRNKYMSLWVGLRQTSRGVFTWFDGTKADLSIFNTNTGPIRYGSKDNSTQTCALMDRHGEFIKTSCVACKCAKAVCEKEVPYHSAGNTDTATSYVLSPILLALGSVRALAIAIQAVNKIFT